MRHSLLSVPVCILLCASAAHAQWSDNFDSYAANSQIVGQGGWDEWGPGAGALVSAAQARSAPNSVDIVGGTDLVREYQGYNTGKWVYKTYQYVPSTMVGSTYFILLNTYAFPAGPYNWSVQVEFDAALGTVVADAGASNNGTATLVTDAWVEIKVFIDLDNDWAEFFYNGEQVGPGYTWTGGVFGQGGGALNIGAVDLYANAATSCYYDDTELYAFEYEKFGGGCPGSLGNIEFDLQLPASVTTGLFLTDINNLPGAAIFHVLGLSKTFSAAGPLPLDLGPFGAPTCRALVSPDAVLFQLSTTPTAPYSVTFALIVPNIPGVVGIILHEQVLALDIGQNALGAVVSDGMTLRINP